MKITKKNNTTKTYFEELKLGDTFKTTRTSKGCTNTMGYYMKIHDNDYDTRGMAVNLENGQTRYFSSNDEVEPTNLEIIER